MPPRNSVELLRHGAELFLDARRNTALSPFVAAGNGGGALMTTHGFRRVRRELRVEMPGERIHRGEIFEQLAERYLDAELLAERPGNLREKQRIETEFQECRVGVCPGLVLAGKVLEDRADFGADRFDARGKGSARRASGVVNKVGMALRAVPYFSGRRFVRAEIIQANLGTARRAIPTLFGGSIQ